MTDVPSAHAETHALHDLEIARDGGDRVIALRGIDFDSFSREAMRPPVDLIARAATGSSEAFWMRLPDLICALLCWLLVLVPGLVRPGDEVVVE